MSRSAVSAAVLLLLLLAAAAAQEAAPAPETPPERAAVEAAIRAVGEAAADPGGTAFAALWDTPHMIDRLGEMVDESLREKLADPGFRLGMQIGFRTGIAQWAPNFVWDSAEVIRVEFSNGDTQAVAIVRTRDADGFVSRSRLWLVKREGAWKFWDFEEVTIGLRATTAMGAVLASALAAEGAPHWLEGFQSLVDGFQQMAAGDVDAADEALNGIDAEEFPPEVESLRRLLLATVRMGQGKTEAAIAALEALGDADMPILDYLWAVAMNRRGESEKALVHARRFVVLVGNDADGRLEEGNALAALGRPSEAVVAYREGLKEDADNRDLLVGLGTCLPDGEKGEIAERLGAMSGPGTAFEPMVIELLRRGQVEAAKALIAGLRKLDPEDPNADYYTAEILARSGQHAEAAKLLLAAIPRVSDPGERSAYEIAYIDRMIEMGKPLEGYHQVRTDAAFEHVADTLYAWGDGETLLTLCDDHGEHSPDDLYVPYMRGRALALLGRRAEAEEAFASAMERAGEDGSWMRKARVENLYRGGEWSKAYAEVPPPNDTFFDLAWLFSADVDGDGLALLVEAHRKSGADPKQAWFAYWDAEIAFLRGQYEKTLELLRDRKAEIVGEDDREALYQWEDRLFRTLIRMGRLEAATALALAIDARDDDPMYPAIVHAAAGRLEEAASALQRLVDNEWADVTLYGDPDLGPLLRKEGNDRLREIVPPPPDED